MKHVSKLAMLFVTFATAALASAGCAAETSQDETESTASTTTEDLTVTRLKGRWSSDSGPIYSIDFSTKTAHTLGGFVSGHAFTARIDNGIRCITAPCPNVDTVSGVYKSVGGKLTLASYDKPTASFGHILGEYAHALSNADSTLTIDNKDSNIHETLTRGTACGDATCGSDTYCCNPLRGICAKPGYACIQ